LLLTAIGFLLASLTLIIVVHRREKRASEARAKAKEGDGTPKAAEADAPLGKKGGFALLLADRYLLLIGGLAFLLNCANTNGEYILDRTLVQHVKDIIPAGADAHHFTEQYIGEFKAHYFLYVNSATVVLQLFAVSRIIKYLGVRVALFIAPLISLVGYSALVFYPVLGIIFAVKISENRATRSTKRRASSTRSLRVAETSCRPGSPWSEPL
jgi:ATP:ADP antiporter, AAA family